MNPSETPTFPNPNLNPNSPNPNPNFTRKRSRAGKRPTTTPNFLKTPHKTLNFDTSDEIIIINQNSTNEAITALSVGFPADVLTDEEIESGVVSVVGGIEQVNYIIIRNHIITKWRENVHNWVTKDTFFNVVPERFVKLLDSAYDYLDSRGFINFGVAKEIKDKMLLEMSNSGNNGNSNNNGKKSVNFAVGKEIKDKMSLEMGNSGNNGKKSVIIIGAGLAGLGAARQLMRFGFKVTVLEGRKRAGGRVYTRKVEGGNRSGFADLGGSVLTGTLGNPLAILAKQLSSNEKLHKVRDKCPLYKLDGKPVDLDMDLKVENAFNRLLDRASKLRQLMGEVSQDVSLGSALKTFKQDYGDDVNKDELNLFNWHLANLEYANAGLLSQLSLAFWDQDDPYDMGGDHCFLPGGNGRLVQALAENVPILYEKTVNTIRYSGNGVQVVAGTQVFEGDMALCTVPLGVLKSGSIKFIPELPQRKLDGIKRLGFGLLNKVAMLFPDVFWGTDLDTFGHLTDDSSRRGEFFLFYSYATVAGGALLIALVAGESAHTFENMPPTDAVTRVLQILRDIYEPQGITVPEPIQTVCTRWGSDPFSLGSYSNVAVGASGDDYDILAENVGDGRVFFAGEATNRRYPATMHGAFLSGLREAAHMARYASVRAQKKKVEKKPSRDPHAQASILADLFRESDIEFGKYAIIFDTKNTDPKSLAVLRVTFSGPSKKNNETDQQHSNKLLFQQLQSHFNQKQEFHIYTMITRQQALDLREVRGGNDMRLHFLTEKLGVKLVGRKGLGPMADSVISSIKADRGSRRSASASLALKSGLSKPKAANSQKLVRRAKIMRNNNGDSRSHIAKGAVMPPSSPNQNVGTQVPTVANLDSGISGVSFPHIAGENKAIDTGVVPFSSSNQNLVAEMVTSVAVMPPSSSNQNVGTQVPTVANLDSGTSGVSIPHIAGENKAVDTAMVPLSSSNQNLMAEMVTSVASILHITDVKPLGSAIVPLSSLNQNAAAQILTTGYLNSSNCGTSISHIAGGAIPVNMGVPLSSFNQDDQSVILTDSNLNGANNEVSMHFSQNLGDEVLTDGNFSGGRNGASTLEAQAQQVVNDVVPLFSPSQSIGSLIPPEDIFNSGIYSPSIDVGDIFSGNSINSTASIDMDCLNGSVPLPSSYLVDSPMGQQPAGGANFGNSN